MQIRLNNISVRPNAQLKTTQPDKAQKSIVPTTNYCTAMPYQPYYSPSFNGYSSRQLIQKVEKISSETKGSVPMKYLASTFVNDNEGNKVPVLGFVGKKGDWLNIALFTKNGREVGDIACTLNRSDGNEAITEPNLYRSELNPFAEKWQNYIYVHVVDNFYNTYKHYNTNDQQDWSSKIRNGEEPKPLKNVAKRLYEMLAGYVEEKHLDDNKGIVCHAREDGSNQAHAHLGFKQFNEYFVRIDAGNHGKETCFYGMYMPQETFNELKKKGKAILNQSSREKCIEESLSEEIQDNIGLKKACDSVSQKIDKLIKTPEEIEQLALLLKDDDDYIRTGTAIKLGEIGNMDHLKLLKKCAYDKSIDVRENVISAISKIAIRESSNGNADAQFEAGNFHMKMDIFDDKGNPDISQAEKYYQKAANQGHIKATKNLARIYRDYKKDNQKARELYETAGNLGDAQSLCLAAKLYIEDMTGIEDVIKAKKLFLKVKEMGSYDSRDALTNGLVSCYEDAVVNNNPEAQYKLARVYENGLFDVKKNAVERSKWMKISAKNGCTNALLELGDECRNKKDYVGAKKWYDKITDQQDSRVQYRYKNLEDLMNDQG